MAEWRSSTPSQYKERRVGHEAPAFQVRGSIFDDHQLSKIASLYGNLGRGRSSKRTTKAMVAEMPKKQGGAPTDARSRHGWNGRNGLPPARIQPNCDRLRASMRSVVMSNFEQL